MLNIIVNCVVGILAIVVLIFVLVIKKKADIEFEEYINVLDEEKFKMKNYLSIGLYLNEHINLRKFIPKACYEFLYRYTNSVQMKVKEVYGTKYWDFYTTIHNGSKWLMAVLGVIAMIAFAGINCINNEHSTAIICVVLIPFLAIGLALLLDKELDSKIEERRNSIMIEFPDFINKLFFL